MQTQTLSLGLEQEPSTLIVGKSQKASEMRTFAERLGATDYTVLIQGETGTGKEVFAREIHRNGRQEKSFVAINCSAIPALLFESILFGHKKGSFTGAHEDRKGRFESVGDGTLFLDEVGTLPIDLQVKLLRVLQDGTFSRIGESIEITTRARILAGTNTNLEKAVSKGEFREDLFYRLNVIPFVVPPLRERCEDVPLLTEHFLKKRKSEKVFTADALDTMMNYHWPGNVRELENTVLRSIFLADNNAGIDLEHVRACIKIVPGISKISPPSFKGADGAFLTFKEVEKRYIEEILKSTRGNISKAAIISGIVRRTLHRRMKEFNMQRVTMTVS